MEVEPEMLVLGVLSEAQSKSKGGLSKKAIGGVLVKRFAGCLPEVAKKRTEDWLSPILEEALSKGLIENANEGLANTTPHYVVVSRNARMSIASKKEELKESITKANEPRLRKLPLCKKNKKPRKAGLVESMDKMKGAGKAERVKQTTTNRAKSRQELMKKLRQQKE